MVGLGRTFNISILTPGKSLMNGKAGFLKVPAHDGMWGILYNHCPVLMQLGMGVMEVQDIPGEKNRHYLVEGGFARVNENHVTVLAYDVTNLRDLPEEDARELVRKAREVVVGEEYIKHQKQTDLSPRKAELLVRLAELDKIDVSQE